MAGVELVERGACYGGACQREKWEATDADEPGISGGHALCGLSLCLECVLCAWFDAAWS